MTLQKFNKYDGSIDDKNFNKEIHKSFRLNGKEYTLTTSGELYVDAERSTCVRGYGIDVKKPVKRLSAELRATVEAIIEETNKIEDVTNGEVIESKETKEVTVTNNIKKMAQHKIDLIFGAYDYGHTKADWEKDDKKMYPRYIRILNDDKLHTKVMQDTIKFLQEEIYFGFGDGVIDEREENGERHDGRPWANELGLDILFEKLNANPEDSFCKEITDEHFGKYTDYENIIKDSIHLKYVNERTGETVTLYLTCGTFYLVEDNGVVVKMDNKDEAEEMYRYEAMQLNTN